MHADFPDWLRELKVTTGYDGIAEVDFLFAESTGINPATAKRATDKNAQKVDETVIEVMSSSNGLQTAKPISVYGFPDVPHHLRVEGANVTGSILSWEATLVAFVEDQYNNPISGQNVDFSMGQARITSPCSSSNNDTRSGLLVSAEDPCMSNIPVYTECGNKTATGVTGLHIGAAAHVILGGLPGAEYPVTVTYRSEDPAITSETVPSEVVTVSSRPLEVCDEGDAPYSALALKVIHATDAFGNIINGGAAGSTIPLYARMYLIREQQKTQDKKMECPKGEPDSCPVTVGTGEFYIDTDFVTASVKFDGTEAKHLGNGLFMVDFPLSPSPEKHEISVLGEATELIKVPADICDPDKPCQLIDEENESPPVTHHMEVCAVTVSVSEEKRSIPVNEDGYAIDDTVIEYTIEPAEYSAATAYFVLEKEVSPGNFEKIAYLSSHTSGKDQVTFLRGFRFDPDTAYKGYVVLNEGSDYMEVKSRDIELIPLMLELDADLNHDGMFNEDDPQESIAPGLIVPLNNDDDDKDGVADYLDGFDLDPEIPEDDSFFDPTLPDLQDDNLIPVRLSGLPASFGNGTVTLEILEGQERIRILGDNTKENNRDSILIDTTAPDATTTASPVPTTYEWQLGSADNPTMLDLPPFVYVEGVQGSVTPGDIRLAISFTPDQGAKVEHDALILMVAQVDLIPDYNHDRKIDEMIDLELAKKKTPFCFWLNDDDPVDSEVEGDDIPGEDFNADANNNIVDGTRDLVDFFPVFIDLKKMLEWPGFINHRFVLSTTLADSLNVIFTDLTPDQAGDYLIQPEIARKINTIPVESIGSDGILISPDFLSRIKDNGQGIILVEAKLAAEDAKVNKLLLEIVDDTGTEVIIGELPLSISGVEEMYGNLDLRPFVDKDLNNHPLLEEVTTIPSNEQPQALQTDKTFIFVHGYNVNEESSRGWRAEIFKRMYWSGSLATFYGVTWRGDESQKNYPILGDKTPNFHINVVNALNTAPFLSEFINKKLSRKNINILASHSLGTILTSASVAHHSAEVYKHFIINAALSIETYDGGSFDRDMVHKEWGRYFDKKKLWCSEWYKLFANDSRYADDFRVKLTWRGYFIDGLSVTYNFHSSGEEVFERHLHDDHPGLLDVGIISGQYSWALQEKWKGRMFLEGLGGSTYGGWGFNLSEYGTVDPDYEYENELIVTGLMSAEDAGNIEDWRLREEPFFRPGTGSLGDSGEDVRDLYDNDKGSQLAEDHFVELLAGFIPATSMAAGLEKIPNLVTGRNTDMMKLKIDLPWPEERIEDWDDRWLHNDIREVAYPYVYRLFDRLVTEGGLGW